MFPNIGAMFENLGMYIDGKYVRFRGLKGVYFENAVIVEKNGMQGVLLSKDSFMYVDLPSLWSSSGVNLILAISQEISKVPTTFVLTLTVTSGAYSSDIVVPASSIQDRLMPYILMKSTVQMDANLVVNVKSTSTIDSVVIYGLYVNATENNSSYNMKKADYFLKDAGKVTIEAGSFNAPQDVTSNGRKTSIVLNPVTRQYNAINGPNVASTVWGTAVAHVNESVAKVLDLPKMLRKFGEGGSDYIAGWDKSWKYMVGVVGTWMPADFGHISETLWAFIKNSISGLNGFRVAPYVGVDRLVRIGFTGTGLDFAFSAEGLFPSGAEIRVYEVGTDKVRTLRATYALTGTFTGNLKVLHLVTGLGYGWHMVEISLYTPSSTTSTVAFYYATVYEPEAYEVATENEVKVLDVVGVANVPALPTHIAMLPMFAGMIKGDTWSKASLSGISAGLLSKSTYSNPNTVIDDYIAWVCMGVKVEVYGVKSSSSGMAWLQIDGVNATSLDFYNATTIEDTLIGSAVMTAGSYKRVGVAMRNTRNGSSSGNTVQITRIVVYLQRWTESTKENIGNWRKLENYDVLEPFMTGVSDEIGAAVAEKVTKSRLLTQIEELDKVEMGCASVHFLTKGGAGGVETTITNYIPFKTKKTKVPSLEVVVDGSTSFGIQEVTTDGFCLNYTQTSGSSSNVYKIQYMLYYIARS
jgi:hypothetical protein